MFKFQKATAIFLSVVCIMCMFAFAASAKTTVAGGNEKVLGSSNFVDPWEKTVSYYRSTGVYAGKMVYGYEETLIHEDYANSLGSGTSSQTALFRDGHDTDLLLAAEKDSDKWSKISAIHQSYYVYYYVNFYA